MAARARARAVALVTTLASSVPWLADASDGPKKPGDPEYHVFLDSLVSSEGKLSPSFSPREDRFTLKIKNDEVHSLVLTMTLDYNKYVTGGFPNLVINDNATKFSLLDPIQHEVVLDKNSGAVDQVLNIRLEDPAGRTGGVGFIGGGTRHHNYAVQIMQPAHYDTVVRLVDLKLKGSSGKVIEPMGEKFSPNSTVVGFKIPTEEKYVDVFYECHHRSTKTIFDGDIVPRKGHAVVPLSAINTTADIKCVYEEKVFGSSEKQKMYTLKFWQPVEFDISKLGLMLMVEPRFGYCDPPGGTRHKPTWVCRSAVLNPGFIVNYADPHAMVSLANWQGKRFRLDAGIPRDLQIAESGNQHWHLVVSGGPKDVVLDVTMIHAAECNTMPLCTPGYEKKTVQKHEQNEATLLCQGETCDLAVDNSRCCAKGTDWPIYIFEEVDTDESKRLDFDEMQAAMKRMGLEMSKEEVKKMIAELDTDKDGGIDQKEFIIIGQLSQTNLFKVFDKDNSGHISEAEWKSDAKTLTPPPPKPVKPVKHDHRAAQRNAIMDRLEHYNKSGCFPYPQPDFMNEAVFYDPTCSQWPPRSGGLGCYAAGIHPNCRFCGFRQYESCREKQIHKCFQGKCSHWADDRKKWCHKMYGIDCANDYSTKEDWAYLQGVFKDGLNKKRAIVMRRYDDHAVEAEAVPLVRSVVPAVMGLSALTMTVMLVVGLRRRFSAPAGYARPISLLDGPDIE